jgi:hypothetical protein
VQNRDELHLAGLGMKRDAHLPSLARFDISIEIEMS